MIDYNIIATTNEKTVITEYKPSKEDRDESYQTEMQMENKFINMLKKQGYQYANIKNEDELIKNLRDCLEKLNNITFTDSEWENFYKDAILSNNEGIIEKTKKIQEDFIQTLTRTDGTYKNIKFIDKTNIHNNFLQVINQYENKEGKYNSRYDVTILVNGFPLVHIELKRRGVAIREAFNQINRYKTNNFTGLYQYVQIFVISNGTNTKYYSNTTRENLFKANGKKVNNSFEFTSYWGDENNNIINDIVDFTKTFFAKHTILNILTKYCVFTSENLLLVMRPYQIAATENIINKIEISTNYKKLGTIDAGGYIWHTTGSGKTLTSFKTAVLASKLDYIDKVLFVVDRKDLDYQTMKEYDKFEKGAANGNSSTKILKSQLEDESTKIIITTIQKLDVFVSKNKNHHILKKHFVIIFDECHRSQFGSMHEKITKAFKNYHIFGFTGTPIFAINAQKSSNNLMKTTEQLFGNRLHTYTIVDAINDKNVLPFRVDYVKTMKPMDNIIDKKVKAIDTEKAYLSTERISKIVQYILQHFNQKTKRNDSYQFNITKNITEIAKNNKALERKQKENISGFNSILAVASIDMAKIYYEQFKIQQKHTINPLKIAIIYSYGVNEDEEALDLLDEENPETTENLDKPSREFLHNAINDYNILFKTNYDTSSQNFQNYYRDVAQRMKNKEIDILIVINMFLTGFDATTLNTLWVDKKLKMHGLIQAFSRTNRILNSIKTYGNIVCFREELQEETEKAIATFGNRDAKSIILMKTYNEYYNGYKHDGVYYKGYSELIEKLQNNFPLEAPIVGEENKKDFINTFGIILKVRNILTSFDDFKGNEILTEANFQDYQSIYLDFYQQYKKDNNVDKENINNDIVFEIELIKQIEINIDYILLLVEKYYKSNFKDKTILTNISKAINSSLQLRSKKELIEKFIQSLDNSSNVIEDWVKFVEEEKAKYLDKIIKDENLKEEKTKKYIENCFEAGEIKTTGTDINDIMPPISRFAKNTINRATKKENIIRKFFNFFDKFFGI
nr:type I restriction endonuclease subunit R [uncultured Tyzzerella sp.]